MYASGSRIGPYVLVQKLGQGGFAPVWLAKEMYGDAELRSAAVKLFALEKLPGSQSSKIVEAASISAHRAQVIEEARVLCRVEHPNVVRFYSMLNDKEHDVIGLAMEYVAGDSLDKVLERGKISLADTFAVGIAVASALAAVHRSGLVHRDVKPANVIDASGVYKLIDFGIAAAATRPERRASREVVVDDLPFDLVGTQMSRLPSDFLAGSDYGDFPAGTLGYMDPETVATGAPATPSSDLYSLGAMLFECLTGRIPAVRDAGVGLSGEILDGRKTAPSMRVLDPSVPRGLAVLVDKLLAPRRSERPKSAEWVARELERLRAESTHHARKLPDEDVGPFRSLDRFEQDDRDVYFGRTVEVAGALELLRSRGFVAVVGPSGSGKSSLARAGVIPAVLDGGLGQWPAAWDVFVVAPGIDPRAAITTPLASIVPDAASLAPDDLVFQLGDHVQSTGRGVFLLVDQLEELATLAAGPTQTWAVEVLVRLAEQTVPGVRTLATARQDLLDSLLRIHQLGRTIGRGSLLVVTPFSDASWMDVLDQALQTYGYALEDDALRDDLREQLRGTATAMPLVQFALTQLWEHRDRERKLVTREALRKVGGIAGALEKHAEATLAKLGATSSDALGVAQQVLLALTTTQGTRATLPVAEIERIVPSPLTAAVLERLERARLFVRTPDGVTIAHEALLWHWRRLQWWVADAQQARETADDLERDANRWSDDPEGTPLLPRRRARAVAQLVRSGEIAPSARALAYLNASRRAANRARILAGTAVGFAVAIAVLATYKHTSDLRIERDEKQHALDDLRKLTDKVDGLQQKLGEIEAALQRGDKDGASRQLAAAQREARQIEDRIRQSTGKGPASARASNGVRPPPSATPAGSIDNVAPPVETASAPTDQVAAPAPSPAPTAPPSNPALTLEPGEGERVLFPHKGAIANKCLAKLHAQTQRAVAITVRVRGGPNGAVEAVTPIGMPPSFDVLDCVARMISAVPFRATQSGFAFTTTIEYTDTR